MPRGLKLERGNFSLLTTLGLRSASVFNYCYYPIARMWLLLYMFKSINILELLFLLLGNFFCFLWCSLYLFEVEAGKINGRSSRELELCVYGLMTLFFFYLSSEWLIGFLAETWESTLNLMVLRVKSKPFIFKLLARSLLESAWVAFGLISFFLYQVIRGSWIKLRRLVGDVRSKRVCFIIP